jgi:hypothetical protein
MRLDSYLSAIQELDPEGWETVRTYPLVEAARWLEGRYRVKPIPHEGIGHWVNRISNACREWLKNNQVQSDASGG